MIITLTGANFSGAGNNIGNLSNSGPFTVKVTCSNVSGATVKISGYGSGATGTGSATLNSVPSGTTLTYTITASGYNNASGTINVTYSDVNKSVSLTAVGSVTPPVTPDPEPEQPGTGGDVPSNKVTITLNATPSDAKASIYKDAITSGVLLTEGIGSASISVDKGTYIVCSVTKEGYYSKTETVGNLNEDKTVSLTIESMNRPDGTNIAQNGTLYEKKSLSSSSYSMTDNESYFVWDQIPVEAGATYQVSGGLRTWWLKSDKKQINTINFKTNNYTATAPTNAAYVSITFPYSAVANPQEAWLIKTN